MIDFEDFAVCKSLLNLAINQMHLFGYARYFTEWKNYKAFTGIQIGNANLIIPPKLALRVC